MLGYPFRAMAVLYDRFLRRCPAAVRGLSLRTFGREVRSLGFPTAHRRRGNCYRVAEVQGGVLAYVMMDSVREKEE